MNQLAAPPAEPRLSRVGALSKFGNLEASVERLDQKYRLLIVAGIAVLYLAPTLELARRKLIWTDEFFTLYLGRLSAGQLWSALLSGGDQHPPTFYLLHHLLLRTFGENQLVLRLPAILGFLTMMVCVYSFVARRTSVTYGLVAMLLPLISSVYRYAYEARGYSLLLGSVALAAVCWQQTGERKMRTTAAVGLALSLTAGVLSHYYTILLLPAFAIAEVVRSLRRRTWSGFVWVALSVPFLPLAVFFPVIKAASGFAGTFWAKASPQEIQLYYETVLGSALTGVLSAFTIAGVYIAVCFRGRQPAGFETNTPVEETVLGLALAAAPFVGYLFGWSVTGVFVWRYAIGGLVGLSILFGFLCFQLFRGSAVAAWLIATVFGVVFAISARMDMRMLSVNQGNLRNTMNWLAQIASGSEPVIIGDSQSFYALSYYSSQPMKQRYLYLVDPKRSLKYLGHDTPDRSLWVLSRWFGLNVQQYQPYIESHREMKVWIPPNEKWIWLLSALIDDGKKLIITGRLGTSILFSAGEPEAPAATVQSDSSFGGAYDPVRISLSHRR